VLRSAITVADHVRRACDDQGTDEALDRRASRRVTISIGVATWRKSDTVASLIDARIPALCRQAPRPQPRDVRNDPEVAANAPRSLKDLKSEDLVRLGAVILGRLDLHGLAAAAG